MEDPPFQVILGRLWLTLNKVNIKERLDGMYIRLEKKGRTYLINVCPKLKHKTGRNNQRLTFTKEQMKRMVEAYSSGSTE